VKQTQPSTRFSPARATRVALFLGLLASPCAAQAVARADSGIATQQPSPPPIEIPLRIVEDWLVVPGVTAEGDTVDLILDTGAAQGAISQGLADRFGLEPVGNVQAYGASGPANLDLVDVPPIFVGGIDVGNRRAIVISDSALTTYAGKPIAGIVGAPFLRRFDVLIDAPSGIIRLYERGTAPDDLADVLAPEDGLSFRLSGNGLINIEATVNGQVVKGVFDTGARHVMLNWPAAERAGIQTTEDPVSERRRGVGDQVVQAHGGRIDKLALGATSWESIETQVADLPIFRLLGFGEQPTMLVGSPVISDCPVLISYEEKTLRFCQRPGT
jgi:predicted aspartyl protease